MKKKRHSPEQIVKLLERGEQMIKDGKTVDVVAGELGISAPTWYGVEEAIRLHERRAARRAEEAPFGERASETAPRRVRTLQGDLEGRRGGRSYRSNRRQGCVVSPQRMEHLEPNSASDSG